mgnify:CR=1 FL=1
MTILEFDEIDKYQEVKEWLLNLTPSQLMEQKQRAVDVVWDFLEYVYVLGFNVATEEVGDTLAQDAVSVLPKDYVDSTIGTAGGRNAVSPAIKNFDGLSDKQKAEADKAIYKKFDNKDFRDRVRQYAEIGNAKEIIRVVETDGNRVYNTGGLNAVKGIAKTKTWCTMQDTKVRDAHDFLQGITVPVEDKFVTYDGDEADEPGDFADPANNVNCRCWLEFHK